MLRGPLHAVPISCCRSLPSGGKILDAMENRCLSVDWSLIHPSIERESFFERLSISSYDAAFIDPFSISHRWTREIGAGADGVRRTDTSRDHGLGKTLSAWMAKRRSETSDLLTQAGGVVVCRLRPRGEPLEITSGGDAPPEHIDRYSWLPTVSLVDRHHQLVFPSNGRFVPRRGRDVILEDTRSPFATYLETFRESFVYDAVYQDLLSTPIERFARILARNKVGDVLAVEIPFDEGRLILIPPTEGVSPSHEASVLMEAVAALTERPAYSALPDWLPSYPLPGEDALNDELARLEERHAALTDKIAELRSNLEDTTHVKRMLFARGRHAFFPAVGEAFRVLGFDVEIDDDVLSLQSAEGDALVVATATEEAKVQLPAYRRLLRAVDQAVTDGDGRRKGILVVSGSRHLDPKRRGTQFSDGVLRGCNDQGYCLLSTAHLFKLVQEALRSKKNLADVRRSLIECDGEFRGAEAS